MTGPGPDLGPAGVPRRRTGTRARRFRGRLVVANATVGYELDEVGEQVFLLVDGERSVRDIAATVAAAYGEDPATVEADVVDLLAGLAGECLIELVP